MTSKELAQDKRMREIYKSSLTERKAKIAEQGGGCAICDRPFPQFASFQDHFHGCCPRRLKKFCGRCNRGILCYICNRFVTGYLEMKKIPIDKLFAYLTKWEPILREKGCYEVKKEATPIRKAKKSIR